MSPVCRALSLFGFALWLMPHVSPGWGFTVTAALFVPGEVRAVGKSQTIQ